MSRANKRQLGAGKGAFLQHVRAEAEQLGRPAAGASAIAGLLDQLLLLDQAAEILLVQERPASASTLRCSCSRVNCGGISSNTTGRYLILARSRAMPVARMRRWSCAHRPPGTGRVGRRSGRRFRHQPGLVEQLVALQHQLLVPAPPVQRRRRSRCAGARGAASARSPAAAPRRCKRGCACRGDRPRPRRAGPPTGNSVPAPPGRAPGRRLRGSRGSGRDSRWKWCARSRPGRFRSRSAKV